MIALTRKTLLAGPMLLLSVEAQALEAQLYNVYWANDAKTSVSSLTCGSTSTTSGCYGSAVLGPFRQACAMVATAIDKIEGPNNSTTYRRQVAIMDRGAQSGAQVTLSIYRETHTIDATNDVTITTSKVKSLTLPLVGGPSASCYLARNASGFYVGTNKSPAAVRVSSTFAVTTLPGFSPPIAVASITAMQGGYVTVTHKAGALDGFYLFRNDGSLQASGGGDSFVAGTQNGVVIPGVKSASTATTASSGALLDAQGHVVASHGKSVVRNSAGAVILDGSQSLHFAGQ
jgi:hypothetical protein